MTTFWVKNGKYEDEWTTEPDGSIHLTGCYRVIDAYLTDGSCPKHQYIVD